MPLFHAAGLEPVLCYFCREIAFDTALGPELHVGQRLMIRLSVHSAFSLCSSDSVRPDLYTTDFSDFSDFCGHRPPRKV
jgi:hypothetical protein